MRIALIPYIAGLALAFLLGLAIRPSPEPVVVAETPPDDLSVISIAGEIHHLPQVRSVLIAPVEELETLRENDCIMPDRIGDCDGIAEIEK